MSEQPEKDSKTEEATPRKIEDALRKGNTPFARELTSFASIAAIAVALQIASYVFHGSALDTLRSFIGQAHDIRIGTLSDLNQLIGLLAGGLAVLIVPLLVLMAAGIAASIVQNPPRMVLQRISPELSRISLAAGWNRLFGQHGRIELAKAIIKFGIISAVVAIFAAGHKYEIINTLLIAPPDLPRLIVAKTTSLFLIVGAVLTALVVLDIFWSRMKWRHDLRMSKQEVKDEHKQSEGDPIVKARQRSIARERARKRMLASVPRATLVIANPTHYAVALRYVRGEQAAPIVVAKGLDFIALKIREIAEENGIPVIEDRALARSLYEVVKPDRPIPQEFYKAVAEIIIHLMSSTKARPVMRT